MDMKYRNAVQVLPEDLIREIQKYAQGEYLYIPVKEKPSRRSPTDYSTELGKRDGRIYRMHLEGMDNRSLAENFHLSGSSIRRILSKQKEQYTAMKQNIDAILSNWDAAGSAVHQIYSSAWQVGDGFILKVYEDGSMLERNIRLISQLDRHGIPVGAVVKTRQGDSYVSDKQYHYILAKRLPGSNIISFRQTPGLAREMGRSIGKLHRAFREIQQQLDVWDNSLCDELEGWVKAAFQERSWSDISEEAFRRVSQKLRGLYDQLPVQLIHRDVHFGNFLFEDGLFCGYIDFDLSQKNIRIFDLCYFMMGLFSEEEKLKLTSEEWFRVLDPVFAGYQEILPLTDAEKQAAPWVMAAIELLFAAWYHTQDDHVNAEKALVLFWFASENAEHIRRAI